MTPPKHVIIATRVYEPEAVAAAHRLGNLARALEAGDNKVTVLTSKSPGATRSTRAIRRWPVLRDKSGAVRGYLQYLSFDLPLFFRLLFGPRADVVVAEPPPTTGVVTRLACWLRGTPYIYYSADVLSSAVKGINAPLFVVSTVRWLESATVRGASGVLVVSGEVGRKVVELGADPAKVADVGTGIDTRQFSPDGPVASSRSPYFVYAGTMSEVHGAGVFIEAFERLAAINPDVELKVFGAGVEVAEIASRAHSERIDFSPLVTGEELGQWLRGAVASLASVRPGRGYDFAFATKALTSLACGTPVVYSGVGPLGPLVAEHDLGWLTRWEAGDVALAMEKALMGGAHSPNPRLAQWVQENYSLASVSNRAVEAIINWAGTDDRGEVS